MEVKIIEHEVESVFNSLDRADKFKPEYLKFTTIKTQDGAYLSTNHYVLSETLTTEEYEDRFLEIVEEMRSKLVNTLNYHMYLCKSGTIYFSPDNKFTAINTTAKDWYLFEYRDDVKDVVELQLESSFLCINDGE